MNEEFDPLDESAGAPEDASEVLERFSRRYRKVYAALHFSLVTAILVAGTVWLDNWVYALLIYIGVRLLLPKGMELFSFMGDYETDSMVVGVGEHVRTIYGNFTEHYGIFSVLRDLLIYGIVCLVAVGFVYSLLPNTIGGPLVMTAIGAALFNLLVFPLIEDVVQFFAAKDQKERLDDIKLALSGLIVILGLIGTVIYPIYVAVAATSNLDINQAMADYYEELGDPDPYQNIDMSDVSVEYSDLRTKCTLTYTGAIDLGYGYIYGGAEMHLKYRVTQGKWQVSEYEYTGVPSINQKITYKGESQYEVGSHYKGLAVLTLTLEPGALEDGSGEIVIIDKASGENLFTSKFTTKPYSDLEDAYPITLETPFPMAYFGVSDFYFSFEKDLKTIKVDAATAIVDMVLTE